MDDVKKQREANRVNVNFPIRFMHVEDDPSIRVSPAEVLTSENISDILKRLENITREIDEIKNFLRVACIPVSGMEGQIVNLGGKGLRFLSEKPIAPGDKLHLQLNLPMGGKPFLNILSEVVWVRSCCDDKHLFEVAVKFINLPDEDESIIVKYTFIKEREESRNKAG